MGKSTIFGAAAFGILTVVASVAVAPAAAGPAFPTAVQQILLHQDHGPVSKLPASKKRELISCVNQVLAGLPNGKKRFVTGAASYGEMESRFGKVVMENRAEWKQKIAAGCASIVV